MQLLEALNQWECWRGLQVMTSTNRGYIQDVRSFFMFIIGRYGQIPVERIQLKDIIDYLNTMQTFGWEHNTLVRKCLALKVFFKYYNQTGVSSINHELIPVAKYEPTNPHVATEEEYNKMVSYWSGKSLPHLRNRAILKLLWDTGARMGEILSLKLEDIQKQSAQIQTEKARRMRVIYWGGDAEEALQRWISKSMKIRKTGTNSVFLCCQGGKVGTPLNKSGFNEMLRRTSEYVGFDYVVNAHSFRHHKGHTLAQANVNNSAISSILGHSNLQSSFRYTELSGKELEETARRFT